MVCKITYKAPALQRSALPRQRGSKGTVSAQKLTRLRCLSANLFNHRSWNRTFQRRNVQHFRPFSPYCLTGFSAQHLGTKISTGHFLLFQREFPVSSWNCYLSFLLRFSLENVLLLSSKRSLATSHLFWNSYANFALTNVKFIESMIWIYVFLLIPSFTLAKTKPKNPRHVWY